MKTTTADGSIESPFDYSINASRSYNVTKDMLYNRQSPQKLRVKLRRTPELGDVPSSIACVLILLRVVVLLTSYKVVIRLIVWAHGSSWLFPFGALSWRSKPSSTISLAVCERTTRCFWAPLVVEIVKPVDTEPCLLSSNVNVETECRYRRYTEIRVSDQVVHSVWCWRLTVL